MDRVPVCRAQRTATSLASLVLRHRRGELFSHTSQELRFFLSSCMPSKQPKKSEEVPNLVISSPEDVLAYALSTLEKRYGEKFSQAEGAEVSASYESDYSKTITYELCARPDADPSKIFGCVIKADHDADKLASLMDDYAQYRFKNQIEEPFLEILQKSTDLRSAARSSRIPSCPIAIGVSTTSTTT